MGGLVCLSVCVFVALPSAPVSVLVTSVSSDSISLSWNTASSMDHQHDDPVLSFIVQYRPTKHTHTGSLYTIHYSPSLASTRYIRQVNGVNWRDIM